MPARSVKRREFFLSLSTRAKVLLLGGIFTTFAGLGGLMVFTGFVPLRPLWLALFLPVHSGASAILWALSFMWSRWLIPVAVFFSAVVSTAVMWTAFGTGMVEETSPITAAALAIVSLAALLIIAGYLCFVLFVQGEVSQKIRMSAELAVAQRIHADLVPAIDHRDGLAEVVGVSLASSEMGGDLIDLASRDGELDLFLADVSGHGVRAGVVMGMVKSAVRMRLRTGASLSDILQDLDAVLQGTIAPDMFATMAALRIRREPGGARMRFVLAGHPPAILVRAGGDVERLDNERLPLGVVGDEQYPERTIDLRPGDTVALYTDGLTETQGPDGRFFGVDRLAQSLADRRGLPLADIAAGLMDEVRAFGPCGDDQTILLVRAL